MGMMREALQSKAARGMRVAAPYELPAPTKGWNTRDPLISMDSGYAILMDNWWPDSDGVKKRGGSLLSCAITAEIPKHVAALESGGISKLLAFSQTKIWDASGLTGSVLQSGNSTYDWDTAVFANRMIMVNGFDAEQTYDGTALTPLAFTGHPSGPQFVGCHGHNGRMYYWQLHSTEFYYPTAAGTFQGALASFPLQYVVTAGGSIVAMQSWSIAGGDNASENFLAIFLSSGEVIVYAGTDPGSDFTLQGHFHAAPILGRRMVPKWGGDVMMGTLDGFYPLSKLISLGVLSDSVSLTDAIQPSVKRAAAYIGVSPYWAGQLYPFGDTDGKGGMLIYNVPAGFGSDGADASFQFVMNIRTGAWTRFSGLNAYDWEVWNNLAYFVGLGGVYQFNTGLDDNGVPITATALQAYSNLQAPGNVKKMNFIRPYLSTDGDIQVAIGLGVDFAQVPSLSASLSTTSSGTPWDVGLWNVSDWGFTINIQKQWQTVPGLGEFFAPAIQVMTGSQNVTWYATGLLYETGNLL